MSTTRAGRATPTEVSLQFAAAVSAGDLDTAAGLFAEDACFLTAEGQVVNGREAIREVLARLLAARPAMSVEIGRMLVTPGGAVGSEHWTMTFPSADGSRVEWSGTSTVIFCRSEERWEILIDAPWGLGGDAALTGSSEPQPSEP